MNKKRDALSLILICVLLASALAVYCIVERKTQESAALSSDVSDILNNSPEESLMPNISVGYDGLLRISEVMVHNQAVLPDSDGNFFDWVELENISDHDLSLSGWSISDRPKKRIQSVPDMLLSAGERIVVFCRDFGLSGGEVLHLLDPDGKEQDSVLCDMSDAPDVSLALMANGDFEETRWPTPGFSNDAAGYEAFCTAFSSEKIVPFCADGLKINEVMVSNDRHPDASGHLYDWIELKNTSSNPLNLDGYVLFDGSVQEGGWSLPSRELSPGELIVFSCNGEEPASEKNTGFSLDAVEEQLFLYNPNGSLADFFSLHDIPIEGSAGKETSRPGSLYYTEPSPGEENRNGLRRVAEMPVCLTAEGAYEDTESVEIVLKAAGDIRFTTDGTVPDLNSERYTNPISISQTSVIRAVAYEEDAAPSRTATFSFFLNEGHVLPILSLVVDDKGTFDNMYNFGNKLPTVPANIALYENNERVFGQGCDLSMKGWTSLDRPKKSMGVEFRGRYGGDLHCDVFNTGVSDYHNLSVRAGQDYSYTVIRDELFQNLCLESSDSLYTQHSKYCILYINGQYYGVYCLKEDVNAHFYAGVAGVSYESVDGFRAPSPMGSDFNKLITEFVWTHDLSVEENYRHVCDEVNIDGLIDWFLFESYCANTDTAGNLKMYRSTENGNRWDFVYYDLDWGFWYWEGNFIILLNRVGNVGSEMPVLLERLMKNPEFKDRVLRRYAELLQTTLSNEHVKQRIDELADYLRPELPRDRERWYLKMESWEEQIVNLKGILDKDRGYASYTLDLLCRTIGLSEDDRRFYFGDL